MFPGWRRIGLAAAALAVAVAALVVGLAAFVHLPPGERLLARIAADAAGGTEIEGLEVTWPFTLSARSVRVSDRAGVWLRIDGPVVDWHPAALTRKLLDIDRLAADRVVVERRPVAAEQPERPPRASGLDPFAFRLVLDRVAAPIVVEPPVLGERLDLDLAGTFRMRPGGGEVDLHLRARRGETLRLAGTAGRDFLDLRWYLAVPRLERWQRLAGVALAGDLTAAGTVAGRLPHPALTGTAQIGEGRMAAAGWRSVAVSVRALPIDARWQASVTVDAEAPAWDGGRPLVPQARLAAAFDLSPEQGRIRVGSARLTAAGSEVAVQGVVEAWGRRADLRLRAAVADLSPLRPRLFGSARAEARVSGDLLGPDLRAEVDVETARLATGVGVLDRLLGTRPQARASVAVGSGWRPALHSAAIDGAGADALVSGVVWPRLDLHARLTVPDLSVFARTLSGAAVVRGRIAGPVERLAAWGVGEVEGLSAAGVPPAAGRVGFDFSDLAGTPAGVVTAGLAILGQPVGARARVVVADDVRIEGLRATSGDSRVEGDLVVADAGVRGRLAGRFPRLARWRDLLGAEVAGSLQAAAELTPDELRVNAEAKGLAVAGATAGSARLRAVVHGLGGAVRGRGEVTATGVERGGIAFDTLRGEVAGAPGEFRFVVDGQGAARVSAAGSAQIDGPRGAARMERMHLSHAGADLRLAAPTRVRWGPDGVLAERTRLVLADGGWVEAEGGVVRGRLEAGARLRDVPLALLELAAPGLDAVGSVDGTVTAAGSLAVPRVTVALRGTAVGFAAAARAGIGHLAATLDATWADGRLTASATAEDGDRLRLAASAGVPLELGGGALLPLATPLSGRIEAAGDLGRLTDALPLAGHVFTGRVDGAATVGGTVGDPLLDGRVAVEDGRYENLETGTLVADLTATGRFDGGRIAVQAQGTDGRGGSARLDGVMDLAGEWRGDLHLAGFRAVQRDDIRAIVSTDLALAGEGAEGRLSGRVTVARAEIDIGRLEGGGPVTLEVVEVNRPGPVAAETSGGTLPATGPLTVVLDIAVGIERAFVRGRGLDSEWGGALQVAGTLSDPAVTGRLVAERGRFEVFGRTFRLNEDSAVEFPGDGTEPRLDVAAEARAEEIVARVEVSGTPDRPTLDVTSDPPLPRDEILSRILFGTEAGKLSAFQQIQLGRMAATGLTGRGQGFDPVGGLRGLLGLDVLEVGQAEEGGAALSAGKYIGEETFLRVEQGTRGAGRVTVEQELGGGFSVTTEVGQERGGGVGVEWRKDY